MVEGQLQKRIREQFKTAKLLPPMVFPSGLEWDDVILKKDVLNWAKEMRKDFPKFEVIRIEKDGTAIVQRHPNFDKQAIKWFVKWLGGE